MESLDDALKESAERTGLAGVYEAGTLMHRWAEIVGEQIAGKTQPAMIKGDTLVVRTTGPAWSHQLTLLKPQLLANLQKAGVKVSDIVFRAATPPEKIEIKEKPDDIKDPPDYRGLPEEMEKELRRAVASFIGARAKNLKRPAKYGKID